MRKNNKSMFGDNLYTGRPKTAREAFAYALTPDPYSGGELERVAEMSDNTMEALTRLFAVLHEKKIITDEEALYIIHGEK
jgi:hypothetical protein